ncbi:MAG: hypothetical protein PHV13_05780 [Candidatus ainarchaeum sp.]|nr:hypothetical protein [Candidatus ainarchaeum sp.]
MGTLKYGAVLVTRDTRNNFKVRPDGGGMTVILKGSGKCPFKTGARVMFDEVTHGNTVDFAEGYSPIDRSWPVKGVIRSMGIAHWEPVLRSSLAAAFASKPGADSLVLYDPLLLGGKLPYGDRRASYYMLALVGKTMAEVDVAMRFAASWDSDGQDPHPQSLPGPDSSRLQVQCSNGAFAAAFKTENSLAMRFHSHDLVLDPLLLRADHGRVRSLPVPGLVRVGFNNMPVIEPDALRLCCQSAVFQ